MKWIVLLISIVLFNTVAFFMKKRVKISEIYTTICFSLFCDVLADTYASFRFQAWGFFSVPIAEFSAVFIILGIYPATVAMIINWYPYKSAWWKKFSYLMLWSIFSTAYEWLCKKVGILWHIHWNLLYSFLLYPVIYYLCLILQVRFYRWVKQKDPD